MNSVGSARQCWEDLVYARAAVPDPQEEMIPVQMHGVTEKCTLVTCLSSFFLCYFAGPLGYLGCIEKDVVIKRFSSLSTLGSPVQERQAVAGESNGRPQRC